MCNFYINPNLAPLRLCEKSPKFAAPTDAVYIPRLSFWIIGHWHSGSYSFIQFQAVQKGFIYQC
jgi:hypothetical protein